jgi:hypothetical protein
MAQSGQDAWPRAQLVPPALGAPQLEQLEGTAGAGDRGADCGSAFAAAEADPGGAAAAAPCRHLAQLSRPQVMHTGPPHLSQRARHSAHRRCPWGQRTRRTPVAPQAMHSPAGVPAAPAGADDDEESRCSGMVGTAARRAAAVRAASPSAEPLGAQRVQLVGPQAMHVGPPHAAQGTMQSLQTRWPRGQRERGTPSAAQFAHAWAASAGGLSGVAARSTKNSSRSTGTREGFSSTHRAARPLSGLFRL